MKLTKEQQKIIHHSSGHARVSAVAGSGKTTTMVARIGHLLKKGVAAENIMVLMFNRSARDAFEHAMHSHIGRSRPLPQIRTFHSLGYRLTHSLAKRGAIPLWRLETRSSVAERLAKQVVSEQWKSLQEGRRHMPKEYVEEFLSFIDLVKGSLEDADACYRLFEKKSDFSFFVPAFDEFEKHRKKMGLRFYADLISDPLAALLEDDRLRQWVSGRVDHIIVDEYQDINEVQEELLKIVAGKRAQVMVVGDVDQCIYEWRGAKPIYITRHFAEDFPDPVNYQLSHTFRYGHSLSLAANHLIANNLQRDNTLCISHHTNKSTEIVCMAEDGKRHPVADVITQWLRRGRKLSEAVILVRLYAQSVPVELALLSADISYRLEGGEDLFSCEEILALLGYLRLAVGSFGELDSPSQRQMLLAIFSQPHLGIKKEELEALATNILPALVSTPDHAAAILEKGIARKLPPFIREHFSEAAANWRWLFEQDCDAPAAAFLGKLVDRLKLYEFYHSFSIRSETAENRVKTCEALINFARIRQLSVRELAEQLEEFRNGRSVDDNSLLITSVHRAKGLEWPLVILPGLEEGSFPFYRQKQDSEDVEDERRLFYVAATRAIEELVCLHPADNALKIAQEKNSCKSNQHNVKASRFLFEANIGLSSQAGEFLAKESVSEPLSGDDMTILKNYLSKIGRNEIPFQQSVKKEEKERGTSALRPLKLHELSKGLVVRHPELGEGIITAIRDKRSGRVTVDFAGRGETLLLASKVALEVAC